MAPYEALHYLNIRGPSAIPEIIRLSKKAKKHELSSGELWNLVNLHGLERTANAFKLSEKDKVPLWLALQAFQFYGGELPEHPHLIELANALEFDKKMPVKKESVRLKPVIMGAHYPLAHGHLIAAPGPESLERHESLKALDQTGQEIINRHMKGGLGFLSFSVLLENDEPVLIIQNIQHRAPFYRLSNPVKRQFGDWHKKAIQYLIQGAEKAGITKWHIVTPEEANKGVQESAPGHSVPPQAAEQFYVRTPQKMGRKKRITKTLVDPLSGKTHSVQVWDYPPGRLIGTARPLPARLPAP